MEKDNQSINPSGESDRCKRRNSFGRLLAEYEPEFAKELSELNVDAPIIVAIREGKAAFEREQRNRERERTPEWLQRDPLKNAFNDRVDHPDKAKDSERER